VWRRVSEMTRWTFGVCCRSVWYMPAGAPAVGDPAFWQRPASLLGRLFRSLWRLLPQRLRAYFAARFGDVTRSESAGYVVWLGMGVVVAVPELWAAKSGEGFWWPTISSTVGHLEDKWAIVAIVPVAVLAASALALRRTEPNEVVLQAGNQALQRTSEGRLAKAGTVAREELPTLAVTPEGVLPERSSWPVIPYFGVATVVVIGASLLASAAENPWLLGYVLYSTIALFWILLPNWLAYRRRTDIPFTTLFFTIRCLSRRLRFVALVFAAGLAVLLIHLALYPWPDLARESAGYAGITPAKAREKANQALQRTQFNAEMKVSAQSRGTVEGQKAWYVYFVSKKDGKFSGCVVTVNKSSSVVGDNCGS
jgi:hypothetical protein